MNRQLSRLYEEVKILRRDIEEIKEMLVPEVPATEQEIEAVHEGRMEFARGEIEEWSEIKKRVAK